MLITNFASGEISPTLEGRTDIGQYYQAAERISNFNIIPTGGIRRRTGFKRLGQLSGDSRLIPFLINKDVNFIFEATATKFYVWKNGQKYMAGGSQVYLTVPYTSLSKVKELQYCQYYDNIIITHPDYTPIMIHYQSDTESFTITGDGISFNFMPEVMLDDQYGYIVLMTGETMPEPSHAPVPVYPASGGKPYPDGLYAVWKGNLYKWNTSTYHWDDADEDPEYDSGLFTSETKRPSCCTFFNGRLYFASSKSKRQTIWASHAPDTSDTRYFDFSTYKKYVTVSKVLKDADAHLFSGNLSVGANVITNVSQNFTLSGILSNPITDYYITSPLFPVGTKVTACTSNTITLSKNATNTEAITGAEFTISLWKSTDVPDAGDYEYKVYSRNIVTEDCGFYFELASEENDAIKWLSCNKYLVAGTESSVWCIPGSVSALNVIADQSGKFGSDDLQALCIDTATVFFGQGKRSIREFYYASEQAAFQTNNIALLAEELLAESPVVDFDYATNPFNRLILTRQDGTVLQLLYDRNNGIFAWSRIRHSDRDIKSCCVTNGDEQNDLLYFVVKDENNYYLERLDDNDTVFLDSWEEYSTGTTRTGNNLVLWNETTKSKCNANAIPDDFIGDDDEVYIGYPYLSDILSLPVINTADMNQKRIVSLTVRFIKSAMPVMIIENEPEEHFVDASDFRFTGVQKVNYPGSYDRDVRFRIASDSCHPVNILSVNAQVR